MLWLVVLALTGVAFGLHLLPRGEMMRLFHAIHVGSWGGIVTKILTFIVCVVGATLPLTGYYIYFKKRLS